MSDDEQRLDGLSDDEEALERKLYELGGLMAELQRAEEETISPFARTLRAHLLYGEDLAPHPTFARRLRAHLLRPRGARPVPRPRRRPWTWLPILAVLVALGGALLVQLPGGTNFRTPAATRADLTFNLLGAPRSGSGPGPTLSLIRRSSVELFRGSLHLFAPPLSDATQEARAYRLQTRAGVAQRGRVRLDINSLVRRIRVGGAIWLVAADGGKHGRPIHSLALSLSTGQLIYHDRRNFVLPRSARPLPDAAAVSVARHWLQSLGWPGQSMPVRSVTSVPFQRKVRQVVLGWPGIQRAAVEEATLWVTPNRSVIEASVWPELAASGTVPVRSARSAWADVTSRKAPVAVSAHDNIRATLDARIGRVVTTLILVPGKTGKVYLIPAYQFSGIARSQSGVRTLPWVSLAPG